VSRWRLVSTVLWQRVNDPGMEHFELSCRTAGWTMRGIVLALGDRGPAAVEYSISCDAAWRTKRATVSLRDCGGERLLHVKVDRGRWSQNGRHIRSLTGCTDLDLELSPSTNTVAIRRLKLSVGARSGPVTAAWVRFPELTLEPLVQEYERVGQRRYNYTSGGGTFRAAIDVDREGLVVDYEGFWSRIGRRVPQK
jgi:hypothetical protein